MMLELATTSTTPATITPTMPTPPPPPTLSTEGVGGRRSNWSRPSPALDATMTVRVAATMRATTLPVVATAVPAAWGTRRTNARQGRRMFANIKRWSSRTRSSHLSSRAITPTAPTAPVVPPAKPKWSSRRNPPPRTPPPPRRRVRGGSRPVAPRWIPSSRSGRGAYRWGRAFGDGTLLLPRQRRRQVQL